MNRRVPNVNNRALEAKVARGGLILTESQVLCMTDMALLLIRILTDILTEYCGARENDDFQLYLAIEDIDHTKT